MRDVKLEYFFNWADVQLVYEHTVLAFEHDLIKVSHPWEDCVFGIYDIEKCMVGFKIKISGLVTYVWQHKISMSAPLCTSVRLIGGRPIKDFIGVIHLKECIYLW